MFTGVVADISGYVTVPFQKGISQAGRFLSERSKELVQIRDLLEQNKELQEQIDEIMTLKKIDLFEYDLCQNRYLKEDMDRYAKKIY